MCVRILVAQLCPTLCDLMDRSLPGSSVHVILKARILEWVAISFSRGSFQSRDWICVSCIAGGFFTTKPPGKPRPKIMWSEHDQSQEWWQGHPASRSCDGWQDVALNFGAGYRKSCDLISVHFFNLIFIWCLLSHSHNTLHPDRSICGLQKIPISL